jgi:hypothetical protein
MTVLSANSKKNLDSKREKNVKVGNYPRKN